MRLTPFYVSVLFLGAFARVLMHLAVDPVNNRGKIDALSTWSPFPAIAYPEMNAESFRVLHPADYTARFLAEGIRPDGRVFTGQRKVTVTTGTITSANGSALVRCGHTSVIAGITGLVTFPSQHTPTHGLLDVSVQMSALCGRQFHAHRPSDDALALSQFLSRTVMR
jgi:exosome complex component RRP43